MKNQLTTRNGTGIKKKNMGLLLKVLLIALVLGLLAGCSPEETDSNTPLLGSNEDQAQDPSSSQEDSELEPETDSETESESGTETNDTTPAENDSTPKEGESSPGELTDSGSYVGQVDSNSIEIKLSGVPDDNNAYKVFELSEELKSTFENLSLETNEQVRFNYHEQENGQPVLTSIERISN